MLLQICLNIKHSIVGYSAKECPLCEALKEIKNLQKEIKNLQKEIKDSQKKIKVLSKRNETLLAERYY